MLMINYLGILDPIKDLLGSIGDAIASALDKFFGTLLYYAVSAICYLVKMVYSFFSVFAGLQKVEYDGSQQYLINVFFGNKSINNIYWAMAIVGIVFVFVFLIIAVVKKLFDLSGKQQQSYGMIIGNGAKSILTILLLSAVMTAVLNITNLLIDRVMFIFDHADSMGEKKSMTFSDDQIAAMARIYNTIGNYSLNTSYNSRYNLNSCYNDIREDLLYLQNEGVFDFYYTDNNGEDPTWQSELQKLIVGSDPRYEVMIDSYDNVSITASTLLEIMDILRNDASFFPIASIKRDTQTSSEVASLDRVIFLMGTMSAARNDMYNEDPSILDGLRAPFYYENGKSIYSKSNISDAFNIGVSGISYLLIAVVAWFTLKNLTNCIFSCISRIINLLGLYIIAPPVISTMPLDGGEKFKQWVTSAVIQTFGVFGCVIPMRLVIMFIPMVLDDKLRLFPNGIMNILAKALLIVGGIEASNRFEGMLTGILANNAGYAAIQAGNMRDFSQKVFSGVAGTLGGAASFAADATGVGAVGRKVGEKVSSGFKAFREKGGVFSPFKIHADNKKEAAAEKLKKRQEAVNMAKLEADEKRFGLNQGGKGGKGGKGGSSGNSGSDSNNSSGNNNNNNTPLPQNQNGLGKPGTNNSTTNSATSNGTATNGTTANGTTQKQQTKGGNASTTLNQPNNGTLQNQVNQPTTGTSENPTVSGGNNSNDTEQPLQLNHSNLGTDSQNQEQNSESTVQKPDNTSDNKKDNPVQEKIPQSNFNLSGDKNANPQNESVPADNQNLAGNNNTNSTAPTNPLSNNNLKNNIFGNTDSNTSANNQNSGTEKKNNIQQPNQTLNGNVSKQPSAGNTAGNTNSNLNSNPGVPKMPNLNNVGGALGQTGNNQNFNVQHGSNAPSSGMSSGTSNNQSFNVQSNSNNSYPTGSNSTSSGMSSGTTYNQNYGSGMNSIPNIQSNTVQQNQSVNNNSATVKMPDNSLNQQPGKNTLPKSNNQKK